MVGVIRKQYWLLKTSDVKIRNCADPPLKKDLVEYVIVEIDKYSLNWNMQTEEA